METKAVFVKAENEMQINQKTAPEFCQLYRRAILLALEEQGVLDELQLQLGMDALAREAVDG